MKQKLQTVSEKLSLKTKLGYGIGAMGLDMSYGLCTSFFMKYVTDVLLVSSVYMGLMMAVARVWDGINDPMKGMIASNTKSKYGRFRPWILLGAILNSLVLVGMFSNPGFILSKTTVNIGLYLYVAVFYVLWGMSFTMIDIPYWGFVPTLTNDPQERNVIASIPRFFSGLGQLTVMGAAPLVLGNVAQSEQGKVYPIIAAALGVMFIAGALVTVSTTRERIVPKQTDSFSFKKAFAALKNNDQLGVFLVVAIVFNLGWYLMNGLAAYFFEYVAGSMSLMTVFAAVSGVGQAIGLVGLSVLAKRIGKRRVVQLAMLVSVIGYIGMFAISRGAMKGAASVVPFFFFNFIAGLGIGCVFTAEASMLADIVDYGEYKLGRRADAIVYSMKSFQLKFSQTIQAIIIGVGLKLFQYKENVLPQPELPKLGISLMMFIIPPVVALLSFWIFTRKYKLYGDLMAEVTETVQCSAAQGEESQNSGTPGITGSADT